MKFQIERRDSTRAFLAIECPRGVSNTCRFSLSTVKAVPGLQWLWNGSESHPTIQPSIHCLGGCNRHFNLTDGIESPP